MVVVGRNQGKGDLPLFYQTVCVSSNWPTPADLWIKWISVWPRPLLSKTCTRLRNKYLFSDEAKWVSCIRKHAQFQLTNTQPIKMVVFHHINRLSQNINHGWSIEWVEKYYATWRVTGKKLSEGCIIIVGSSSKLTFRLPKVTFLMIFFNVNMEAASRMDALNNQNVGL